MISRGDVPASAMLGAGVGAGTGLIAALIGREQVKEKRQPTGFDDALRIQQEKLERERLMRERDQRPIPPPRKAPPPAKKPKPQIAPAPYKTFPKAEKPEVWSEE